MFQRILVPLDGSSRAERAIPVAARIARTTHGSVLLLRVAAFQAQYGLYLYQAYPSSSPVLVEEMLDTELEQAHYYLTALAHSETLAGITVEMKACTGVASPAILAMAREQRADLIVMCSHGRTGFKRWALGSVAQKIVRQSPLPVLLLREGSPAPVDLQSSAAHPLRALVALDGSPFAEASLIPAAHLVAALAPPGKGALHLAQIVSLPEMMGEQEYTEYDEAVREQVLHAATIYMNRVAEHLRTGMAAELALQVTWSVSVKEDIANTLIKMAELGEETGSYEVEGCDLIAMATHGLSGFQRWMIGSITERVLDGTTLPLLIVRPQELDTSITRELTEEEALHVLP
jgi:nucleotide-binding universal stress UspA family protein